MALLWNLSSILPAYFLCRTYIPRGPPSHTGHKSCHVLDNGTVQSLPRIFLEIISRLHGNTAQELGKFRSTIDSSALTHFLVRLTRIKSVRSRTFATFPNFPSKWEEEKKKKKEKATPKLPMDEKFHRSPWVLPRNFRIVPFFSSHRSIFARKSPNKFEIRSTKLTSSGTNLLKLKVVERSLLSVFFSFLLDIIMYTHVWKVRIREIKNVHF